MKVERLKDGRCYIEEGDKFRWLEVKPDDNFKVITTVYNTIAVVSWNKKKNYVRIEEMNDDCYGACHILFDPNPPAEIWEGNIAENILDYY